MSPLFVVLMGAALSCGLHTKPGRIDVGLYATFQDVPSAAVREAFQEELSAAVTPLGILVHWRSESDLSADAWWNRVATIQFQGGCDPSDLRARPPHPWKFGRTQVSEGKVIPYAEIHCDALRAYLGPTLVLMGQRQGTLIFGRALGRVLAHELYHILAKTRRHGSHGIGKESFTPGELTADEFQFDEQEVRRLRGAIFADHSPVCPASE